MKTAKPYSETWFGLFIALAAGILSFLVAWKWSAGSRDSLLDAAQKLAFINSGFIVAAFNLRFRMLDVLTKEWFKPAEFDELKSLLSACTGRINAQIIYYVLISAFMAAAPLAQPFCGLVVSIIIAISFFLFVWGLAKFLQILVSFSRLEAFVCSAIKRENDRKTREQMRSLFTDDSNKDERK